MSDLLFAYGPYVEPAYMSRVLGRELKPRTARLAGFRVEQADAYFYLIGVDDEAAQGCLYELQTGDLWLLDDHFGVEHGFFRRIEVPVAAAGPSSVQTYVAGPTISLWKDRQPVQPNPAS